MGVPTDLVLAIRHQFSVDCFVETGTFQAGTAVWAGGVFSQVYTIEASPQLHAQALSKFGDRRNIQFLQGSSPGVLRAIAPKLPARTIFWLDAHWSGGETAGQENECPLLDEIDAIDAHHNDSFILIDDARLFLAPPPLPHNADHWPNLAAILAALLAKNPARYIVVLDDVIIAAPKSARDFIVQYCQKNPK